MKVSIVLTVYNKELFLEKALSSLTNQEGIVDDLFEILVVNDGSKDASLSIINRFASIDKRIRVINQDNQGLSRARNNGMEAANGDYIWFVDADDYISSNAIKLIVQAIQNHPDIIPIYAQTAGEKRIRNMIDKNVKSGKDVLLGGKWEQCGVFYIYRKSFLQEKELSFLPGIYHEDAEFTPRMLYFAESVEVIPQVLYTVVRDPNSITQVPHSKRAFDYLIVASNLSSFVEMNSETRTSVGRVIDNSASVCINNAMFIILRNSVEDQTALNSRIYENSDLLYKSLKNSLSCKYILEGFLFSFFPRHPLFVYKMLNLFR